MDLCSVTVTGFRRLKAGSRLQTNGKLVALLGPNEAGKSSLLHAIALLGNDGAPAPTDFSRGANRASFLIEGHFFLSKEDLEAAGLTGPHWLFVQKGETGQRTYTINPPPPKRNIDKRYDLRSCLAAALANRKFRSSVAESELLLIEDMWVQADAILSSDIEDITPDSINLIDDFVSKVSPSIKDTLPASIKKIPFLHTDFLEAEKSLNPRERALRVLPTRLSGIIIFDENSRNLLPEYAFSDLEKAVPLALDNLCDLAKISIASLISAQKTGDTDSISTIEYSANNNLEKRFKSEWQQSNIRVSIRVQGDRLVIQIVNEKSEFTSLAERSDGLRQFVALLAFSGGNWKNKPIMLIDEVEQRLHYDAQADLVQMLARQQVASKVIYTTHSAGCLPEDLGNGVRLIHPSAEDATRSEIRNKFWGENELGFTPLLYGMGATTLAFFPTRSAVMVEGASDMLLLPTMMRSALSAEALGFQFVPGLSNAGFLQMPSIGEASRVLYLVDGDAGGGKIQKDILSCGISGDDIFVLRSADGAAIEVEDFLHQDLFVDALNSLIDKYHFGSSSILKSEFSRSSRMDSAEKLYVAKTGKKLQKVSLAYEILDILADDPGRTILDHRRSVAFRTLVQKLEARFARILS